MSNTTEHNIEECFGNKTYATLNLRSSCETLEKESYITEGGWNFTIFEDDYFLVPQSWLLCPHGYLNGLLNDMILRLSQHGIIMHIEYSIKDVVLKIKLKDPGPQILTMKKLSAGFIVWISTVSIACIVFLIEHIYKYFDDKRKFENSFNEESNFFRKTSMPTIEEFAINEDNDDQETEFMEIEELE